MINFLLFQNLPDPGIGATIAVSRLQVPQVKQVQPGATVNVKIDAQNPANAALQLA